MATKYIDATPSPRGYSAIAQRFADDIVGRIGQKTYYGKSVRESQQDVRVFLEEIVKISGMLARQEYSVFEELVKKLHEESVR